MLAQRIPILLLTLTFLVDRALKILALRDSLPDQVGPLKFTLVRNSALAFSIPVVEAVALVLAAAALVLLVWLMVRRRLAWAWPWVAVLLGGASNVYDRIRHGAVIDYLQIGAQSFFNVADVLIGVGIIALLVLELTRQRRRA